MDEETWKTGVEESRVEVLLDLEEAIRNQNVALNRANKILSTITFTAIVTAGTVLYALYWLETHNAASRVLSGVQ